MFRPSRGHLQADNLKHTIQYTDHVRNGDFYGGFQFLILGFVSFVKFMF